jgi:hypothetical protein
MLLSLAAINFALAAFDGGLTRRRINDYGVRVELNRAIQLICLRLGVEAGVLLGIMIPVAAQTILFYWLNWPIAFALLIGFRLKLFLIQWQSLIFEKQIRAIKRELNRGGRSDPTPSRESSDQKSDNLPNSPDSPSERDK